jgi:phenylacetate-CoA ligase
LGDRHIELCGTDYADNVYPDLKAAVEVRFIKQVEDLVMNRKSLTIINLTTDNLERNWWIMQSYQPKYLFGFASAMYVIAQFISERGYDGRSLGLKLLVTFGEILYDWQRDEFAKVFGCPTADEYCAIEVGVIAYEHPCDDMHIMDDYMIAEIIKSDPQDEFGEVIVTNLENWGSPLIRYNLQDLAYPFEESFICLLSLGFSRLESVVGRHNDTIRLPDGRIVHSAFFTGFVKELEYVHNFQVNQKLPDSFEVLIVTETVEEALEVERFIQARMHKRLGTVDVCVKRVPAIPTEASGKLRFVRSEVEWNDL